MATSCYMGHTHSFDVRNPHLVTLREMGHNLTKAHDQFLQHLQGISEWLGQVDVLVLMAINRVVWYACVGTGNGFLVCPIPITTVLCLCVCHILRILHHTPIPLLCLSQGWPNSQAY